jgi:hypothetical protein
MAVISIGELVWFEQCLAGLAEPDTRFHAAVPLGRATVGRRPADAATGVRREPAADRERAPSIPEPAASDGATPVSTTT